ncbi:MAG TPA: SDR family oxidoreductase [Acidimicrobiales bacterium]|nr:SDR family oxidoreductase [Acidimicrobiales bacterium]
MTARLPGLAPTDWSPSVRALLDDAVARVGAVANPLPTLTLIAHQEPLLEPFLVWARAIGLGATLSRRTNEIVALRTSLLCGSGFEWHEHCNYARAYGMSEDEIAAIAEGPGAAIWGPADRAALQAADDLHRTATVSDATWAALAAHFSTAEVVELVLVAGQYRLLSGLANTAGVVEGADSLPDARSAPEGAGTSPARAGAEAGAGTSPARAGADAGAGPGGADALLGLRDAVALVTGGSRSIGRGCAVLLARAGCHVVIADRADGAGVVEEVERLGRGAVYVEGDMRSKADVQRAVDAAVGRFGRLDVAVNTVGSTKGPKPFLDIDLDEWDDVVAQNLTTTMLCMQAEALAMVRLGTPGRIINVASLSGVAGAPNAAGYGAANAGVIHVTRSAALELARYGIRVNCIVPGTHYTEAVHEAQARDPQIAEWVRQTGEACPLGRIGEVWETAGVAVFLASTLSSFVTGEEIVSDGGTLHTTARPPIGMAAEADAVRRLRDSGAPSSLGA